MSAVETAYLRPTQLLWETTPLADVAPSPADDGATWITTGSDPQFSLDHARLPLPPGWYRLRGMLREVNGRLAAPCLYPDYGQGISEATRIDLGGVAVTGVLDAVIHFPETLHALRFDPTDRPATFELKELCSYKLSEREAFWLLLRSCLHRRLATSPDEALELLGAEGARWRNETPGAALRSLAQISSRDATSGVGAYAQWAAREDRHVAALLRAPREEDDNPAMLSLVLWDLPHADFSASLQSIAGLRDGCVEVIADAGQLGADAACIDAKVSLRIVGHSASLADRVRHARGHLVATVSAEDQLHPTFAAVMATAASARPDAVLFYTDEDRLDGNGQRRLPFFKPAWDLLRWCEQDYLGRSAVIRRDGIDDGLLESLDPALPWFSLLCGIVLRDDTIKLHVPHVLRHVTGPCGPVSAPFSRPDPDADARAMVLNPRLHQSGLHVAVGQQGRLHLQSSMAHQPTVEIIIPTRDRIDLLEQCIASLINLTAYPRYRITVVNNGSVEPQSRAYFEVIGRNPRIRVLDDDRPFNYSALNNRAVAISDAEVVVLLNNDIEIIEPSWLEALVGLAMRPGAGAIGAKLLYPDGSLQHAGVILGVGGVAGHAFSHLRRDFSGEYGRALLTQRYSAVTAACLAVTREAYVAVGGLDESIAVAFNDVDFCLRLREHGYDNAWTPQALAYHHESASRGIEDDPVKQARFAGEVAVMQARWAKALGDDPAYSPCFSLDTPAFSIDADRHASMLARDMQAVCAAPHAPPVKHGVFH